MSTKNNYQLRSEYYISLIGHILLLFFTCGIWQLIWIYKVTKFTNKARAEVYRNPTTKLLLCLFIPFYQFYWTYQTAKRIDKISKQRGRPCDIATLCLILSIFIPIVPPILMQANVNDIEGYVDIDLETPEEKVAAKQAEVNEMVNKFQDLLSKGAITKDEFKEYSEQLEGHIPQQSQTQPQAQPNSYSKPITRAEVDEMINNYQSLLGVGAITREEFEAYKLQLESRLNSPENTSNDTSDNPDQARVAEAKAKAIAEAKAELRKISQAEAEEMINNYQSLLGVGGITREEFEAYKSQLEAQMNR